MLIALWFNCEGNFMIWLIDEWAIQSLALYVIVWNGFPLIFSIPVRFCGISGSLSQSLSIGLGYGVGIQFCSSMMFVVS